MTFSISLLPVFQWLDNTSLGIGIRSSIWWYPVLEATHVFGSILVLGNISLLDLRLLGCGLRREPVSRVAAAVLPWTWFGFSVQCLTGFLILSTEAVKLYHLPVFWMKMGLVLLGL